MCTRLTIVILLTVAWVAVLGGALHGQSFPPPGPPPATDRGTSPSASPPPMVLLEQAIRAVESHASISARIRQTVDLFGQQLVGTGTYLEQRTGGVLRFRLETKVQHGDQLLLCDGEYLWKLQRLHDQATLVRIDIARVLQTLEETGQTERLVKIGAWSGVGGLGKLLRGLYSNFEFQTVEPGQLAGMVIENGRTANQLNVWKLSGQWNRQRLAAMLPQQSQQILAGQPVDLSRLAEPLPHCVEVHLGRDDLFPYRIDYFRNRVADRKGQGGVSKHPIVTVEFIGVNWNPIDRTSFVYNPGNLDMKDQTKEFLENLLKSK